MRGGTSGDDSEEEFARAYTGALFIAELTDDVKRIRHLLTPKD